MYFTICSIFMEYKMKILNIPLDDFEYNLLVEDKKKLKLSWRNYLIHLLENQKVEDEK